MMTFLTELWEQVLKTPVLTILSLIATTYGTILAHKLSLWMKLKNEDEVRQVLHGAADNAINFAAAQIGETVTSAVEQGKLNKIIDLAKNYVQERNPKTLERSGVTEMGLEDILKAKVGKNVGSVETK